MNRKSVSATVSLPSGHRPPIIAGVGGGVGASTVAACLGAGNDWGVHQSGLSVDVMVCRSTASSVAAALVAVQAAPGRPVLVVVGDAPGRTPRTAAARLRMVEPHVAAVIPIPWVEVLRDLDTPVRDLSAAIHAAPPPRWALPARTAVTALVTALAPLLRRPDPNRAAWVPEGTHAVTPPSASPRGGFTSSSLFRK